MKKQVIFISCLMTVALMSGMLSGCGEKASGTSSEPPKSAASSAQQTPEVQKPETPAVEGTEINTTLISMVYPSDWTYQEEETEDTENNARILLAIMDGEDSKTEVSIRVSGDGFNNFKDQASYCDLDLYETVVNHAGDWTTIDGHEFVVGTCSGEKRYFAQDEKSGLSMVINVSGDTEDTRIDTLLSTIAFHLPDNGKTNAPWPWEGERFASEEKTAQVGDYTITVKHVPTEEPILVDDIWDGQVEVIGNSMWILADGHLYEYALGDTMKLIREVELVDGSSYEKLSTDNAGNLYVSGSYAKVLRINGDAITELGVSKEVEVSKSGTWGVAFPFSKPIQKITLSGDTAEEQDWAFASSDNITHGGLTDHYIYISGKDPEFPDVSNFCFLYDQQGKLKMRLGNTKDDLSLPDYLASITDVVETSNGILAIDGNFRKFVFWKPDGTLIGSAKDSELLGTYYPWISSMIKAPDGSIYIGASDERTDKSATEFVVFKLSGF